MAAPTVVSRLNKTISYTLIGLYLYFWLNANMSFDPFYETDIILAQNHDQPTFCQNQVSLLYWIRHVRSKWILDPPIIKDRSDFRILLLIISGIETNPGPRHPRFPCGICKKACKDLSIACDECDQWIHKTCLGMSTTEFSRLGKNTDSWKCPSCEQINNSTIIYSIPQFDNNTSSDYHNSSALNSVSDISFSSRSSISTENADSTFNMSNTNIITSSPKPTTDKPKQPLQNKLRVVNINFQSLRKKGKLLETFINECDPDIIIGTETWLDDQIASSELLPNNLGYDIHRRDRPNDPHGGVLIAAKRHLLLQDVQKSNSIELISGHISIGTKKVCVASYYRPPNKSDKKYLETTTKEITALKIKNKSNIFVIGGDFNLPDVNWKDLSIDSTQYPKALNKTYLDLIADNSLEQVVDFPTRKNKTLDLLLTSHPGFKLRCKPLPSIGNSDHDVVLLDTTIAVQRPRPQKRQIYLWKKANMNAIKDDLRAYSNKFRNERFKNIESMWKQFKQQLNTIVKRNVPTKLTSAKYTNPWMNTTIKRTIKKKQKAFKKARKTGSKRDKDRYKRLQKETQAQVRKANRKYMQDIISESYHDKPKRFWSYIKSKKQEATGVAPLKDQEGFLRSDNQTKANILNKQFCSVFTKEKREKMPDKGTSTHPKMPPIAIGEAGVFKLLKNLNCHKATGPDEIPNQILHSAAEELAPILTKLYQYSLDTGSIPQDWREANIVPIYKKGDRHIPANYRPISLTSVTCKLLEHIVHSSVMTHFDKNGILCSNQHGFRKKRSCESQLLVTIDTIARQLSNKDQVDIILLDFEKAFDKVPHRRLLYKLNYYGVGGTINKWIEAFLVNRKQQVVLDGAKSTQDDVLSGVPQGTVLGPLLFLTYINDMPEVSSSDVRLFADDSLLYRPIQTPQDNIALQKDLDALERWEKTWMMSFNASKCYVLHISSNKTKTRRFPYRLHGQTLQAVEHSQYLGVTISENLTWNKHIQNVASKGNRTLGFVKRNLKDCTQKVKAAGYCTLVRPRLEYASTVWDPHIQSQIDSLEQVQRRAARFVVNDYTSRSPGFMTALLKNLEWETLQQRRQEARLTMLYRIHHSLVDIDREMYLTDNPRTRARFFQERITDRLLSNTFFPRTIVQWNRLPPSITAADSLEGFQARLTAHP